METAAQEGLRLIPSAVEGLPAVTEVVVFPNRLELLSEGRWVTIRLLDIARWCRRGWLYRPLARLGFGVWSRPFVADLLWFPPPGLHFLEFYTEPSIVVHVPYYTDVGDMDRVFQRVKQVIAVGGFSTFDLHRFGDRGVGVRA